MCRYTYIFAHMCGSRGHHPQGNGPWPLSQGLSLVWSLPNISGWYMSKSQGPPFLFLIPWHWDSKYVLPHVASHMYVRYWTQVLALIRQGSINWAILQTRFRDLFYCFSPPSHLFLLYDFVSFANSELYEFCALSFIYLFYILTPVSTSSSPLTPSPSPLQSLQLIPPLYYLRKG